MPHPEPDQQNSTEPLAPQAHDATVISGGKSEHGAESEEVERPRKRVKKSSQPNATETESSLKKGRGRIPEEFRKERGRTGLLETLAKDVPLDGILEI
ncbi:hypothetical protein D9757_011008 [Collybiopsis confluens]|uniref:Uncharacterized protein n=1 Tax=Collybiopsis confluens TaxID=2823264 RepID=A0A8H5GD58_9AGAR|nr:hypothetical protein D9757_011008 [Collybiopsis confluens]